MENRRGCSKEVLEHQGNRVLKGFEDRKGDKGDICGCNCSAVERLYEKLETIIGKRVLALSIK